MHHVQPELNSPAAASIQLLFEFPLLLLLGNGVQRSVEVVIVVVGHRGASGAVSVAAAVLEHVAGELLEALVDVPRFHRRRRR